MADDEVSNGIKMEQNSSVIAHLRKGSLYSFIVFLAISAVFAIASVLSGNFGDFEIKVLITTLVISVASICSLCCSVYSNRVKNPVLSVCGILLAGVAALMLILGIWTETNTDGYWKTTASLSAYAIAFAHSLVLLAIRLRSTHAWLQLVATINIFTVATIVSAMIFGEVSNASIFKVVAVLAILVALETLVIPILGYIAKGTPGYVREILSLTKREDGTYEDNQGHLYEVKKISDDLTKDQNS